MTKRPRLYESEILWIWVFPPQKGGRIGVYLRTKFHFQVIFCGAIKEEGLHNWWEKVQNIFVSTDTTLNPLWIQSVMNCPIISGNFRKKQFYQYVQKHFPSQKCQKLARMGTDDAPYH